MGENDPQLPSAVPPIRAPLNLDSDQPGAHHLSILPILVVLSSAVIDKVLEGGCVDSWDARKAPQYPIFDSPEGSRNMGKDSVEIFRNKICFINGEASEIGRVLAEKLCAKGAGENI